MKKTKIAICISLIAAVLLSVLLIPSFAAEPVSCFINRVSITPHGDAFAYSIPQNVLYSYKPEVIIKSGDGVSIDDGYISGLPSASSYGFETHILYDFNTIQGFDGVYKWETEMSIVAGTNFYLRFYLCNETSGFYSHNLARYDISTLFKKPQFVGGENDTHSYVFANRGTQRLTAYYSPENDCVAVFVNGRYFWSGSLFKDGEKPASTDTMSFRMSLSPISTTGDTTFKLCREELFITGVPMADCLVREGALNNYNDAYNDGFYSGRNTGHNEGYDEGYRNGDSAGYNRGETDGYNNGYSEGKEVGKAEAISDIGNTKGLLLTAVSAPFNAIKEALNFELFGINLAALFFFLFTAVLIAFVIKKLRS